MLENRATLLIFNRYRTYLKELMNNKIDGGAITYNGKSYNVVWDLVAQLI